MTDEESGSSKRLVTNGTITNEWDETVLEFTSDI